MLNANEPEARLVAVHVKDGQPVQKGDLLFTIETTKAASDVESPASGFFRMVAAENETLAVGATLAFITKTADEPLEQIPVQAAALQSAPASAPDKTAETSPRQTPPADLRITKPALALAESLGLELSTLPKDRLVTESYLRQLAGAVAPAQDIAPRAVHAAHSGLVIYGAGGHAKAVMEMARAIGAFRIAGIVDDNPSLTGTSVLGIPVLGTRQILPELAQKGLLLAANGVGGIINIEIRIKIFELLAGSGFAFPILCHPRATVEQSAEIYDGVQVFANAYVGSSAILHEKCMINTGAIVSHDCEIGAYTHIAPGAMLAGHVHVGEQALVGMGVTTAIGVRIGAAARVGNGAILLADVPAKGIVQAGKVWMG
jgi:sugar O-acyltransferase (sialic acid O-acetyltransferase NeuD family)